MAGKIDSQAMGLSLTGTVSETFSSLSKEKFSDEPNFETLPLDGHKGVVEVSGFRKFAVKCYVSYVSLYNNAGDREKDKPIGAIVLYLKDSGVVKFMKAVGYLEDENANKEDIQGMCGEFCNVVAGAIKKDLMGFGFSSLEMGTPSNYRDSIEGGIKVNKKQKDVHELKIFLFDANPLVIDIFI